MALLSSNTFGDSFGALQDALELSKAPLPESLAYSDAAKIVDSLRAIQRAANQTQTDALSKSENSFLETWWGKTTTSDVLVMGEKLSIANDHIGRMVAAAKNPPIDTRPFTFGAPRALQAILDYYKELYNYAPGYSKVGLYRATAAAKQFSWPTTSLYAKVMSSQALKFGALATALFGVYYIYKETK